MENELNDRKKRKRLRDFLIFLAFVFLAAVLLGMMKLSKTYTYTIDYNIVFSNTPFNSRLCTDSTGKQLFQIKAEGRGYDLLALILNRKRELSIDLSQYYYSLESDATDLQPKDYYIYLTQPFSPSLSNSLNKSITILEVQPAFIKFTAADIIRKKVPVVADINITFDNQYILVGQPVITPDSIEVYGEHNLIDTITSITTQPFSKEFIHQNFTTNLPLKIPAKVLSNITTANLSVQVERYTSQTLRLPIHIKHQPHGKKIILDPAFATITYFVPLSLYHTIDHKDFSISVNGSDTNSNQSQLSIELETQPTNASHINIFPPIVDFYIQDL